MTPLFRGNCSACGAKATLVPAPVMICRRCCGGPLSVRRGRPAELALDWLLILVPFAAGVAVGFLAACWR